MLWEDNKAYGTRKEAMLDILQDKMDQCLIIYIDDMIIYCQIYERHARQWKQLLKRLDKQKVHLNISKCQFFPTKLEMVVHVVTFDTFCVDANKTKTILGFPAPACKKDFFVFIGRMSYLQQVQTGLASDASTHSKLYGEYT